MTRSQFLASLFTAFLLSAGICLSLLIGALTPAMAWDLDHDPYSMDIKGFSPDFIKPVQIQVDRQEGRYPPKPPARIKKLFWNLLNNDPTASKDVFGYDIMDSDPFPRIPGTPGYFN